MNGGALKFLSLAALTLAGCGKDVSLPLEMGPDDVAVLVSTVDGRATTHVRSYAAGEGVQVPSDPDRPIYAWVLRAADHITPDGASVSGELLAGTVARLTPNVSDPGGATGACGRCLIPTAAAPIVVSSGDACPLPRFVRGSVWRKGDSGFACRGASDGTLCPAGDAADDAEIEEVRRRLRLDRPGACACTEPEAPASLAGMSMEAIAPAPNPVPLYVFAKNAAGQVAGFSRAGVGLFDPGSGEAHLTPDRDWPVSMMSAVALRNGDFLATGELFNSGAIDLQGYFRFHPGPNGLEGPIEVEPSAPVLAERMRYLGQPGNEFPLYLIGGVRDALGISPAVYACTEDRLACQQVHFSDCPMRPNFSRFSDALVLENGFGLAVGRNALYYKAPTPGGPSPRDTWRCDQPEGPFDDDGGTPVHISRYVAAAASGDRLYVCAVAEVPACQPEFAVVLTATAGATDPQWRLAYRGPNNSWCADFIPRPDGMTLVRSGYRLVHMDLRGAVTGEEDATTRYGGIDGFERAESLGDGWVLGRASENRMFVATSSAAFTPIYGPAERTRRVFVAAVPRPGGGFWAFGENPGPVLVRIQEADGRYLGAEVVDAADPTGTLSGARITGAALDPADPQTVLVVGRKDGPLIARLKMSEAGVEEATRLTVPAEAGELRDVAAMGPGTFAVSDRTTRLFAVRGDAVTEVSMSWDRPDTPDDVERRPPNPVDGCSGNERNLDLWRGLGGGSAVAHAVGTNGLLFRVEADTGGAFRAERFAVPETTQMTAASGMCPQNTLVAGRGEVVTPAGITEIAMRFFLADELVEPLPGEVPDPTLDPRRLDFEPVNELEVQMLNVYDLKTGLPRALLPDVPPPGGRGRTFGVVLENGLVHRMGSGQGLTFLRVPFSPEVVAQDGSGYVLFGSGSGRMALGVPGSRRE